MARQRIKPVYLSREGKQISKIQMVSGLLEAEIRDLIQACPDMLPMLDIDPAFRGAVSVCTELRTPAGPIDNLLITPEGLPVLIECKLWRNPQARREVVGQVLDYAKELSRWTAADLEREAARRGVSSLADLMRQHCDDFDEISFYDTLTRSLAKGRCLLLVVGDGIRESVEAIFDHLQQQSALQFSFALVECPIFEMPDQGRLAIPRVLARSVAEIRKVVALPEGMKFEDDIGLLSEGDVFDPNAELEKEKNRDKWSTYWTDYLSLLKLDDPEQPLPKASKKADMAFSMPGPRNACWLTVYRLKSGAVGIFLATSKGSPAERVIDSLMSENGDEILKALGQRAILKSRNTGMTVHEEHIFRPDERTASLEWLAVRTNDFINVLKPFVKSAMLDAEENGEL